MKITTTFLLLFSFLLSVSAQQKKDLYIIDFHSKKEYNSILGKNVAGEFENNIQLCRNKYRVIPRMKYQRQLEGKTFEYAKRFLKEEGIDYMIYGNISYDDNSKNYTIEYIFEETSSGNVLLIESIKFDELNQLINPDNRSEAIKNKLKDDEDLCKHFSGKAGKPEIIDEDATAKNEETLPLTVDSDGDGVPDSIDKEPNSPIGATVDKRGVEVFHSDKGDENWSSVERKAILKMLPDLPNIPFEESQADLNEDAYMKLDQMARLMKMYPVIIVKLEGFDTADETLAKDRATTIKEFLIKNYRLPASRFIVKGSVSTTTPMGVISSIALDEMDF